MSALDYLADAAPYHALQSEHPNGMSFRRQNARVVRDVISIMRDRLRELGMKLQLRVEPLHFPACNHPGVFIPPPNRVTVKDGDLHWRLGIECHEGSIFVDDKLVVTAGREDGVMRVVRALVSAIKGKVRE